VSDSLNIKVDVYGGSKRRSTDVTKIIRTPTKATGGITAAEKAAMAQHAKLWIARALRTDPIEPDRIIPAIRGLYRVAGLAEPRVVIVPSPLVMAFAYGAAAAIWHNRGVLTRAATRAATFAATDAATRAATFAATDAATHAATDAATIDATIAATRAATIAATHAATDAATDDATRDATFAATDDATDAATIAATRAATFAATHAATDAATDDATDAATIAATRAATFAATDAATRAATFAATDAATHAATDAATIAATRAATFAAGAFDHGAAAACFSLAGHAGLNYAAGWYSAYQGGNMWASWDCYLTAARDILGLRLPSHDAYTWWEQAAIHGGFRVLHPEFCIVSDFPELIRLDAQHRPHCDYGPSHRWRDGWALYHWHGVRVPAEWIEDRASLTPHIALTWPQIELRRAACEILGWNRILQALHARIIDTDRDPEIGELVEVDLPDSGPERFLRVRCGTGRDFVLPVPRNTSTALAANAWTYDISPEILQKKEFRT
jgi:hypothetical protein